MTRKFISIGECMVELAPTGDDQYKTGFAGDTFNTAWYFQQLSRGEVETHYYSGVGDDALSWRMTDFIRSSGISFEPKVIKGGSVGLYMITLTNGERSFSYWRSVSAARSLAVDLAVIPEADSGDLVFFSGITVAILTPETRQHFLDLLSEARTRGVTVCFDPNLRPRLWANDAEMCDWITRAASVSDIVLPSHEDEASYFGDADPHATAQRYRDLGATLVVVKDGPNAVLVAKDGEPDLTVTPQQVDEVVDSTAAGDSFNAGFLSVYLSGGTLADAVEKGCEVSAHVISQHGALVELTT